MLTLIDQDIVHRGAKKSYQVLMHSVQAHLAHRHMTKMRDDLDNVNQGAAGTFRKGGGKGGNRSSSAKPQKGDCTHFLGGRCTKGSSCEFKHDYNKLKQLIQAGRNAEQSPNKNNRSQSLPPNSQRSGGSRDNNNKGGNKGKGKGKGKDGKEQRVRGTSPSGKKDAKMCHFYKKGTCIHGNKCDFWHPPKCNKFPNCPLGSKCSYFHPAGDRILPSVPAQSRENSPAKADGNVVPKPKGKAKAKAKAGATQG